MFRVVTVLRRDTTGWLGLLAAGALALLLAAPATARAADPPVEQWRSYWVDAFHEGIYSAAQVDELVVEAQEINANALLVQVGRRFDCFCNRSRYPRTEAPIDAAPYDPLDTVIDRAHAAGLEVHAWINATTLWNSPTPPRSAEHAFNQHGPSAAGAQRWLNKRYDGAELIGADAFLDPANPAAVDYVVAGVQSLLREYDVDGVNLDYIRYPDHNAEIGQNDWGYSETSLARFRAASGRLEVPQPTDKQFSAWRREQVTNLVRKIYLGMWEIDPQARLSVNGVTYGDGPQSTGGWENTRPYTEVMQDWKGWLSEGIVDTNVAMNYKRDWRDGDARTFAEWTEALADWQAGRQSVNGTGLSRNDVDGTVQQVKTTVTPIKVGDVVAGWSGYSYASPSLAAAGARPEVADAERDKLATALTAGPGAPFVDKAAVPAMPWKEDPASGHLVGEVRLAGGSALDQGEVTVTRLGPPSGTVGRSTDGSGWFGFVDLAPGKYLVVVTRPGGVEGRASDVAVIEPGEIGRADFALRSAAGRAADEGSTSRDPLLHHPVKRDR